MIKEYSRLLKRGMMGVDVLLTLISFLIAYWVRNSPQFIEFVQPLHGLLFERSIPTAAFPLSWHVQVLWFVLPVWLILLHYFRCYELYRRIHFLEIVLGMVKVEIFGTLMVGSYNYFAAISFFNRAFIILFIIFNFLFLLVFRLSLVLLQHIIRRRGFNFRRVLIVGINDLSKRVIAELEGHNHWGLKVFGLVSGKDEEERTEFLSYPVIGGLSNLGSILRFNPIDDVIVALPEQDQSKISDILKYSDILGTTFHLVPGSFDLKVAKPSIGELGKIGIITFSAVPDKPNQLLVKKIVDYSVSILLLPFLLLILIVVSVLIKLDSPGSVFYTQTRVTKNRRTFKVYKFRTMVPGADRQIDLLDQVNEMNGPIRKSSKDPRVTPLGRFLRKSSIDELPQLLNVLKGEMSLVGPRPPTPEEVEKYTLPQLRKLSMLQGITGLWQVSGRDRIKNFEDRILLDLKYIDAWSIWLDLKICLKTLWVVFRGAY